MSKLRKRITRAVAIIAILAIAVTWTIIDHVNYEQKNLAQKTEYNTGLLSDAEANLNYIEVRLDDKKSNIEESMNRHDESIVQQEEKLKTASEKLDEAEEIIVEMENAPEDEKGFLCESARATLDEAQVHLDEVQAENILISEEHTGVEEEVTSITNTTTNDLQVAKAQIDTIDSEYVEVDSTYEKHEQVQEKNDTFSVNSNLRLQTSEEKIKKVQGVCDSKYETYSILSARLAPYEEEKAIRESLHFKLESMGTDLYSIDMSVPLNLTEEEIRYLLEHFEYDGGKKLPEEIIEKLPAAMVEAVKEYPVNEICVLGVDCMESWYFTSDWAVNRNNFGGLMPYGSGLYFESVEEGVKESVRYLYNALGGSNTIEDIRYNYNTYSTVWSSMSVEKMQLLMESQGIEFP